MIAVKVHDAPKSSSSSSASSGHPQRSCSRCLGRMSSFDRDSHLLAIPVGDALWDCRRSFFFLSFFFFLFFSFFPPQFCPAHISGTVTRRLQIECAAWSCGLVVHCCLPSNSLRYFLFFSAKILSGPYLWNRYSQRLQIECAAWSCGLVVHCCLPSNSLRYFFSFFNFFLFFRHNFVQAISLELLLAETPN